MHFKTYFLLSKWPPPVVSWNFTDLWNLCQPFLCVISSSLCRLTPFTSFLGIFFYFEQATWIDPLKQICKSLSFHSARYNVQFWIRLQEAQKLMNHTGVYSLPSKMGAVYIYFLIFSQYFHTGNYLIISHKNAWVFSVHLKATPSNIVGRPT